MPGGAVDNNCYRCGEPGHRRAQCPSSTVSGFRPATPPQPAAESPVPSVPGPSQPPPYRRVVLPECQVTRARVTGFLAAAQIRAAMGWGQDSAEERKRQMARDQVELSRRLRLVR